MAGSSVTITEAARLICGPVARCGAILDVAAIGTMLAESRKARRCETGGILIGRYDDSGWTAHVVEATPQPADSWAGWFWFRRGNKGLAELLEARWNDGLHYLGEWHFHPKGSPAPSAADHRAMARIARNPLYACDAPLLVILGGNLKAHWDLSVTVARVDEPPVRLR
jgi:integrative and conjugative element protein (TIGR02256 family)